MMKAGSKRSVYSCVQLMSKPRLHGFGDEGRAVNGKFDTDHQAFAADFLDEGKFCGQFFDASAKFGAARGGVGENFCFFENFQEFESDGADHGTAAECCAVNSGADAGGDRFGGEDCSERKAGGERLCYGYEIGLGRKLLVGEVAAGAAETTLNFVGDEQRAVLLGEGPGAIPEGFADGIDAAFALDCFDDDWRTRFCRIWIRDRRRH